MPQEKKERKDFEVRATVYMCDGRKETVRALHEYSIDAVRHAGRITGAVWRDVKYPQAYKVRVKVTGKCFGKVLTVTTSPAEESTVIEARLPAYVTIWERANAEASMEVQ